MAKTISGIVTWLKGWFYDKTEIGNLLNTKANLNQGSANMNVVTDGSGNISIEAKPTVPTKTSDLTNDGDGSSGHTSATFVLSDDSRLSDARTPTSHSHGQITNDGKNTSTAVTIASDDKILITDTSDSNKIKRVEKILASQVKDSNGNTYTNIDNTLTANSTQSDINGAINTVIGTLQSIRAIEIVSTLPTASSSTMGKLYIISENGKVNVYYTQQSGSSYSWHKMDADILDELEISWNDVTNKPNFATVATSGLYSDLSGTPNLTVYEEKSNKVVSSQGLSRGSTDTQYPSAKTVYELASKIKNADIEIEYYCTEGGNRTLTIGSAVTNSDIIIDWGDGTINSYADLDTSVSHTYPNVADNVIYKVKIKGDITALDYHFLYQQEIFGIKILNNVERIKDDAIVDCTMTNYVYISDCVKIINDYFLYGMYNIKHIIIDNLFPPSLDDNGIFRLSIDDRVLTVPIDALYSYMITSNYPDNKKRYSTIGSYTINELIDGDDNAVSSDVLYDTVTSITGLIVNWDNIQFVPKTTDNTGAIILKMYGET